MMPELRRRREYDILIFSDVESHVSLIGVSPRGRKVPNGETGGKGPGASSNRVY